MFDCCVILQLIWHYNTQHCPSVSFLLMKLSNVLEVLSSSANFIIYCVCRHQFRLILRSRLRGRCVRSTERHDVITLTTRRQTTNEL